MLLSSVLQYLNCSQVVVIKSGCSLAFLNDAIIFHSFAEPDMKNNKSNC